LAQGLFLSFKDIGIKPERFFRAVCIAFSVIVT